MAIPDRKTQIAALVREQGGPVEFVDDYPIPTPGNNEVLAKVLYTGVCHSARGTASGPDGENVKTIKLPHVGGHEGVGRIVALGPNITQPPSPASYHRPASDKPPEPSDSEIRVGALVGIRFIARVCHRCESCLKGMEQYCPRAVNHLYHEDGAFQEYCLLDAGYLVMLPDDTDQVAVGPTLCAGVTAYKGVLNADVKAGETIAIVGAAGGLGHFAVQYARASGARVIAVDSGPQKKSFLESMGAAHYVDISTTSDPVAAVRSLTDGNLGVHGVVVTAGSVKAYSSAAEMLRVGGTLSCVGIIAKGFIETPTNAIVIRQLRIVGSLVGSSSECLDAVGFVQRGEVKPKVTVRGFRELADIYEDMEQGKIEGRVVVKVAQDE
ncbi:MAG: hypothetical protein M1831_006557 [Alyxoria varia]|nr:MAG: hypothetical protein M1831_006557 [Alyxoria varia]